jgi:hypothetical protein
MLIYPIDGGNGLGWNVQTVCYRIQWEFREAGRSRNIDMVPSPPILGSDPPFQETDLSRLAEGKLINHV